MEEEGVEEGGEGVLEEEGVAGVEEEGVPEGEDQQGIKCINPFAFSYFFVNCCRWLELKTSLILSEHNHQQCRMKSVEISLLWV